MDAEPDIMVFAKGIASGFPFAGIATKPDMFQKLKPGSIGGTYSGNTLGCAAACATIDAIKDEDMLGNATQRGKELVEVYPLQLESRGPCVLYVELIFNPDLNLNVALPLSRGILRKRAECTTWHITNCSPPIDT